MNMRFLAIFCMFFASIAPMHAESSNQSTEGPIMTKLRNDYVHLGCGLLAAASWALWARAQRAHSQLASETYPQRQQRVNINRQLTFNRSKNDPEREDALLRQLSHLQIHLEGCNKKASNIDIQRWFFGISALIFSGATLVPWIKTDPTKAKKNSR